MILILTLCCGMILGPVLIAIIVIVNVIAHPEDYQLLR